MDSSEPQASQRVDKWLWAARFFKTRALAVEAVAGGKVHVNGERVKPSRAVKPGDELRIQRGLEQFVIHVRGLNAQRRPASEAQALYEETEASRNERERRAEERRLVAVSTPTSPGRPSKKDRRRLERFVGRGR